jgi:subfamily B ATP-binding cassette protein MsbA
MAFRPRRLGRRHEADPDPGARPLDRSGLALFRRLLAFVRPYRRWLLLSVVALLFSVALSLVLPLVVRNLVDVVLLEGNPERLNQIAMILLGVFVVQALFSFAHQLSLAYAGERAIAGMRITVFTHLQRLGLRFYAEQRTGELISRLTNDVSLLQEAITNNLVALLRQALTLIGAAALLFVLNWRLTLVILAGIPAITLIMVFLGRRIRMASMAVQDRLAGAASVLEEATSGVRIVKSFTRESYEIARFRDSINRTFAAAMQRACIQRARPDHRLYGLCQHHADPLVWQPGSDPGPADGGRARRLPRLYADGRHAHCLPCRPLRPVPVGAGRGGAVVPAAGHGPGSAGPAGRDSATSCRGARLFRPRRF